MLILGFHAEDCLGQCSKYALQYVQLQQFGATPIVELLYLYNQY